MRWQEERDAVEEEVVAFDGGDLERMKQKTRGESLDYLKVRTDYFSGHFDTTHTSIHRVGRSDARLNCGCRQIAHALATPQRATGINQTSTSLG
jgi:hypothetical protein